MVVYAQQDSGGRMGGSQPIQEGTSVRERQDIVTIPSATGMVAQVSLHESVLKQVSVGQNCLLKIDALGVREFQGRVSFVAVLPDQNSWWANPNTRLYRTEVQILDGIPDMRPGMSCQIEILVDDIPNATYAPVQAVFRSGGDNIAFVTRPGGKYEERKVQVGRYTNNWVEIVSGLEVGELVMLTAPVGFSPAPAPQAVPTAPTATTPGAGAANAAAPAANANAAGPGGAPAAAGDGAARPAGGERGGRAGGGERGARGERGAAPATGADGAAMSEEERERMRAQWRERMANMSEEERAKLMEQMRQRGQGGAGEAGGAGAGGAPGGGQK
jgi:hypothetical protein